MGSEKRNLWTVVKGLLRQSKLSGNCLPTEDVSFLLRHTGYDTQTLQRQYQEFIRHCPEGRLLPDQFSAMYRIFFHHQGAEEFGLHIFRSFDIDHNGFVDFREYMLALHVICDGSNHEKLSWAFRLYDIDSNGVIDRNEVTEISRCVLSIVSPLTRLTRKEATARARARAKEIFHDMDRRKQGFLTHSQFVNSCLRKQDLAKMLIPLFMM